MAAKLNKVFGVITSPVLLRVFAGAAVAVASISADPVSGVANLGQRGNLASVSVSPKTSIATDLRPEAFGQVAKINAADGAAFDQFGSSVAISGDYAVVGADRDDDNRGAAYIFVRSGNSWTQQQKLIAGDTAIDDNFGSRVAISADTVVVGAYGDDNTGVDQGSAYVFVRSGTVWSQQQKLTASDGAANDQFGSGVAIDGNTIFVGAFGDDSFRGSAYAFTRSGSTWTQQQKLTATDGGSDDDFGWSVGLSGESAVIGSPRDDGSRGSAFVFARSGAAWSQQAKLVSTDGALLDQFGYSVGISGDHVVIGAVNDAPAGSAYVFFRSSGAWSQQQKLNASGEAAGDNFGTSVAIDGLNLIVGANGADNGAASNQGRASVWIRTSQQQTTWSESQQLKAADGGIEDNFGASVAVSGSYAIVGSYLDDNAAIDTGSAYIFNEAAGPSPTPSPTATPIPTPTPTLTPTPTPTPGTATITGRLLRPSGQALANTRVFLTDEAGARQIATTGSFGIFTFTNVVTGRTYFLTASSKRFRFASVQITPLGDVSALDMIGLE